MSKKYIIKKYNYENNSYLTIGSYDSSEPIRKICGDCYYNGFCKRKIKECVYLEEEQKKCKTKDCKK